MACRRPIASKVLVNTGSTKVVNIPSMNGMKKLRPCEYGERDRRRSGAMQSIEPGMTERANTKMPGTRAGHDVVFVDSQR
jgi:hypothetical protein